MNIPIKTTQERFFRIAIRVLNPVLKLSNKESDVLSSIMLVLYANRNIKRETLEKNILSYKSRVALRSKLDMSEASLNNNISALKKKGIIVKTKNGFDLSDSIRLIVPNKNEFSVTFNIYVK
jgi:biotin operon repressor